MKKTYIAPSSTEFAMMTESSLLLNSIGKKDDGTETGASDALSRGIGGWNCEMWSADEEEE